MFSSCISSQEVILYKQIDQVKLNLDVYFPENYLEGEQKAAMVFFFGGGWNGGSTAQFKYHADYFSKRGIVCFVADYRVKSRHQTTPFESLKDAKSAIRFVRANAQSFNIDPNRIIAAGGSAGGHLAAATAVISSYNEATDDLSHSCIPNALVLFNPVIDNGPGGFGYERIGLAYKEFSPIHNIQQGAPPTIIFLGTDDKLIPVETAKYYQTIMEKIDSRCELKLYDGRPHGFFNYAKFKDYTSTIKETDEFLKSLDYLDQLPVVPIE